MPVRCALGCERTGVNKFPSMKTYPEKFKAWVHVMNGKLDASEDYELYRKKRICPIHFKKEDYNRNSRLNALAVPSLHLPAWCAPPVNLKFDVPESRPCILQSIFTIGKMPEPSALRIIKPDSFLPAHCPQLEEKEYIAQRLSQNRRHVSNHDDISSSNDIQEIITSNSTLATKKEPRTSSPVNCISEHNYCWTPKPKIIRKMFKDPSSYMTKMKAMMKSIRYLKHEVLRLRKRSVLYKTKLREAKNIIRQSQKHIKKITKEDFNIEIKSFTLPKRKIKKILQSDLK